jgi:subtilisin-like proprotein convertase family protein
MKKSLILLGLIVMSCHARAAIVLNATWTVNTAIPDGNPVGITVSQLFQNLPASPITGVDVSLNINGGYNGDLYAALVLQDANGHTTSEILLNQVGTSTSDPFGSAGSGFNVTLSDSGNANGSIHNASGNPAGTWLPDSPNTLNGTFGGLTANGTWTLFIADMSVGGGTETLNSWGLDIGVVSVPESSKTGIALGLAGLLSVVCGWIEMRSAKTFLLRKAIKSVNQ